MNNATELFSKRLKELRIRAGLKQDELAKKIGISRGAISYYENGDRVPDINVLYDIAEYFNVTSDYLIGRSNNSTTDLNIQDICNKTGLSDKAVENIIKLNTTPVGGYGSATWLQWLDYILSKTLSIDIINGREPDEHYWESVKEKEFKGSASGLFQGEFKCIFYYGKGIDFLRKLNHILFDEYLDFNPYAVVGKSGNIISVIDKQNSNQPINTFAVLDTEGNSHVFKLSVITKALLLELNELLTAIRGTIKHNSTKDFLFSFDEESNFWHKSDKERTLYSSSESE